MQTNFISNSIYLKHERLMLGSGIVAALCFLGGAALFIATIAPHLPPLDASAAEATAFYAAQDSNLVYRMISYLGMTQLALLPLFFGALFGVLRRAEGGEAPLATAVLIAGAALSVITPLAIMLEDHLLLGMAAAGADPIIVRGFDGIGPLSFALGGFAQTVVLFGCNTLLVPAGRVPRWIGWFGNALIVLSLLASVTLINSAFFPATALTTLLFRVWLLALSIALVRTTAVTQSTQTRITAAS